MTRRSALFTACLLVAGAVAANAAFLGLAAAFDYPDVLQRPADVVLTRFQDGAPAIVTWFLVLAGSAALLGPIAWQVGRLSPDRAMRVAVWTGVAAAAVQVVGLLRWPLLVPGLADRLARANDEATRAAVLADFELAHRLLGTLVGETFGYLLTAVWTILVLVALGRRFAGGWFVALGSVAAALIALGALSPLGVPLVDGANFAGYVLWSGWLVAFAVVLALGSRGLGTPSGSLATGQPRRRGPRTSGTRITRRDLPHERHML